MGIPARLVAAPFSRKLSHLIIRHCWHCKPAHQLENQAFNRYHAGPSTPQHCGIQVQFNACFHGELREIIW